MSSILKALKKLESEKSQRDELSTAVASDILRSSRRGRASSLSVIIAGVIVAVILVAMSGYFIATRVPNADRTAAPVAEPRVAQSPAIPAVQSRPDRAETVRSVPSINLPELSGIVYQDNVESRLAVINDLPVMEGTLVEGFLVKSIQPDKVVISQNGTEYDLRLRDN